MAFLQPSLVLCPPWDGGRWCPCTSWEPAEKPGPRAAGGPGTAVLLWWGDLRSASHLPGPAAKGCRQGGMPMLVPVPSPPDRDEGTARTSPLWCPGMMPGAGAPRQAGRAQPLPYPSATNSPGLVPRQLDVAAQNQVLGWGDKNQGRPGCPSTVGTCPPWLGKVMISPEPVIDMRLFINILCSE